LLGGGAYAATQLPKNSVGTSQLKNGAVTLKKISKRSLAALENGPSRTLGPAGAAGRDGQDGAAGRDGQAGPPGTAVRWALVNGNGAITASSDGATKATIPSQNSSQYFIDFHTSVANRPILVSTSYQENPGFADTLQASPCGGVGTSPGATNCPLVGGDNDHTVFVLSTADGMLTNPQGFYVVLLP
jgi:hypothetical protein